MDDHDLNRMSSTNDEYLFEQFPSNCRDSFKLESGRLRWLISHDGNSEVLERLDVTPTFTPLDFRVHGPTPLYPPTVLSAKLPGTHRGRPRNVIYSSHTWQEETPLGQCPSVVPIIPQTSTAFRQAS
jgi:hypothetical protein